MVARKESRQRSERCLPILILREVVVRLKALQPYPGLKAVLASCVVGVIVKVNRLRVMPLFEPTLAPAVVIDEAPFEAVEPAITTAYVGTPERTLGASVCSAAGT